jgi:cleavage stimulation factor subunit 2
MLIENEDIATAATAVRNLNGYDIGSRQLRVDFSEKESYSGKGSFSHSDACNSSKLAINHQSTSGMSLPPLPEGKIPPPGVSIPNAISQTLQSIPPQQLTKILSQLKAIATNNPEQGPFP